MRGPWRRCPPAISGAIWRDERLETGVGAQLPPAALSLKVTFLHDSQHPDPEGSKEEACWRYSLLQRTEQDLLEIPTLLRAGGPNPIGQVWL